MKNEENKIEMKYMDCEHPTIKEKKTVIDKITSPKVMAVISGGIMLASIPLAMTYDNPLTVVNVGIWGLICSLNIAETIKEKTKTL